VSTFWRYLQSLGRVQSDALLRVGAAMRERVWALIGFQPQRVTINMDPTASTVYGDIEESCRGYNPHHRGKKALRPVLCFIEETREYLLGEQRRGKPLTEEEIAGWIGQFRDLLPSCVVKVLVRGDSELMAWRSVKACYMRDYDFIFANRRCAPPFPKPGWYQHGPYEYNECLYQPQGWEMPCRFVALRMPKEVIEEVEAKGYPQSEHTTLDKVLPETDVLYVTRVQRERFEDPAEYEKVKSAYVITPGVMKPAKAEMIVMHPLPRITEISMDFDDDPRAAYFRQMEYGLYVRMALLAMVLGKA
jgi:hypothetical protein